MVTEGLPVGCISCIGDESHSSRRPSTVAKSPHPAEGVPSTQGGGRTQSSSSDKENGDRATFQRASKSEDSTCAVETPPESPRVHTLQTAQFTNSKRRESSFRKTYDENDKKRAIPCDNCALTLPKKTNEAAESKVDNSGPILRTRKPYERVSRPAEPSDEPSPPKSLSSSDSDTAISSKLSHRRTKSRTLGRAGTSSSNSSFNSTHSHHHYLDYTSTHEPLAPTSFSMLRQSCLRTLSCETLPPSSQSMTSPASPFINYSFSAGSPSASTSSGGPIFFGDPLAGYTTAYIFRIPDPNARGRRRVYAIMALSTHRERLAMSAFSFLTTAFKELAAWIQGLAELELERQEHVDSPRVIGNENGRGSMIPPTSAFLSGRNRGMDGKFAGTSLQAKGLAELVGLPDFFIELHARFVRLLIELSLVVGSP